MQNITYCDLQGQTGIDPVTLAPVEGVGEGHPGAKSNDRTKATVTSKLDHALGFARRGLAVFPLRAYDPHTTDPDGPDKAAKKPAIKNWRNLATTDPIQIRAWWTENPDYNIGHPTDNEIVVDVDFWKGGKETFAALGLIDDFPSTMTTRTQSGGMHLYYALPPHTIVRGKANKLGQGADVKSWGGYCAMPGSTIADRAYVLEDPRPIALAPQWLIQRCKLATPKPPDAGKRVVEETPGAIDAAWKWMVKHAPTAVIGERGSTAYKIACQCFQYGVSDDTCREIITEWSYAKCEAPMTSEDIEASVSHASTYMRGKKGEKSPDAPGFEPVEIARKPCRLATPWTPRDARTIPPRSWIVSGLLSRKNVGMLAGPPGASKSTLTLMLALAIITQREDICGLPISVRVPVWLWNQEDPLEELERRLAAIMFAFDISPSDLYDGDGNRMLFLNSGVDLPLILGNRSGERAIVPTEQVEDVVADIVAEKIGFVCLDPLVEFHTGEENDNVQMRAVLGIARRIAVRGDCAVLVAGHTRKSDKSSSKGFAGEMEAIRGASSQIGVARSVMTLFTASADDAKKWNMDESHLAYARLDMAKTNLAKMWTEPKWFRRDEVNVNGEPVGILRPVALEKKGAALQVDILEAIAKTMAGEEFESEKGYARKEIIEKMNSSDAKLIPDKAHWARDIPKAFDGRDEYATSFGLLSYSCSGFGGSLKLSLEKAHHSPNITMVSPNILKVRQNHGS